MKTQLLGLFIKECHHSGIPHSYASWPWRWPGGVLTLYLCLSLHEVWWSVWKLVILWRRKSIVRTVRLEIRHGVCPSCPLFSFYMLRYSISDSCYWFSKSELWAFVFCDFSGGALFFCCLLQTPTAWVPTLRNCYGQNPLEIGIHQKEPVVCLLSLFLQQLQKEAYSRSWRICLCLEQNSRQWT